MRQMAQITADELLAAARAEIGTKEQPQNSNRVKYNTAFYGREVSGAAYPWCVTFIWWLFWKLGAAELFCGGQKTASSGVLMALSLHGLWQPMIVQRFWRIRLVITSRPLLMSASI